MSSTVIGPVLTYEELTPEDQRRIDTFCHLMATAIFRKMEADSKGEGVKNDAKILGAANALQG